MSEKNITQKTKEFYEQYHFPGDRPIDQDGLIFLRKFSKAVEKITSTKNKVRVLDAGCGTGNTSISLAVQFKDIDFLGLDNSSSSLEKAKLNAKNRGLTNLKFRKWNLLKPMSSKSKYDIVLCLGVLHHTGNMEKVLINLNKILDDSSLMFLWIYGRARRDRRRRALRGLHRRGRPRHRARDARGRPDRSAHRREPGAGRDVHFALLGP